VQQSCQYIVPKYTTTTSCNCPVHGYQLIFKTRFQSPINVYRQGSQNLKHHGGTAMNRNLREKVFIGSRHRVGRVLSFFSSRRNWDSPTPSPAGECAPSPWSGGRGHIRWRVRGWESPNSDEGTYTVVLYIYKYFMVHGILDKNYRVCP
jgi:hypothetical protein